MASSGRKLGMRSRRPLQAADPLSAREFLVFDALRKHRVLAQAPLLVLFIGLEIALEPFDMAVALEGEDVGRDPIEEEAIVADDHGAAGKVLECGLERGQ